MTSSEPSEPSARPVGRTRLKCRAATTVDPLRVGGLRASTVLRVTIGVAMGAQLIWRQVTIGLALCGPCRAGTGPVEKQVDRQRDLPAAGTSP